MRVYEDITKIMVHHTAYRNRLIHTSVIVVRKMRKCSVSNHLTYGVISSDRIKVNQSTATHDINTRSGFDQDHKTQLTVIDMPRPSSGPLCRRTFLISPTPCLFFNDTKSYRKRKNNNSNINRGHDIENSSFLLTTFLATGNSKSVMSRNRGWGW